MPSLFSRFLFSGAISFLLRRNAQYFFVFDIGGFGVKALFVELAGAGVPVIRASAHTVYVREDLKGDALSSPEAVYSACKKAYEDLKRSVPAARSSSVVILGISGGFVSGKSTSQFYSREYPEQEINQTELKYILQHTEQRAYEEVRKEFARDTGRPDTEVYLFNSFVQEVKIDGYRVANPLGFTGSEVSLNIFNAYISRAHTASLKQIFERLGLRVQSFVYTPFAIYRTFLSSHSSEEDALFIDIGGSETILAIMRKGKLESVGAVAVGGNAFTQKLAQELDVGFWEAEHIKMRYNEGHLSTSVTRKVTRMFELETSVFLNGLELVLSTISQANLLPSDIYLYGGASDFALIQKAFKKRTWKENLSFIEPPKIHTIDKEMFQIPIYENAVSYSSLWAPAFSLVLAGAAEYSKKDDILQKTLKRMVKIIQE